LEIIVIDYIEGILAIKKKLAELEKACLERDLTKAKDCCYAIIVEARAVNHQLTIQSDK
jgi:hypothetical protein